MKRNRVQWRREENFGRRVVCWRCWCSDFLPATGNLERSSWLTVLIAHWLRVRLLWGRHLHAVEMDQLGATYQICGGSSFDLQRSN